MNATITHIRPRLRLVDESSRLEREGKKLTYVPREGVQVLTCHVCAQPIVHGLCGCSPRAA